MPHVFISYNQADADFAALLMMTLERAGFDTWFDKNRLRPGADWSDGIDEGILDAFAVVLIMSPDSKASEYVTYEWSFALGAGKHVVPVLRRDTEIHPRLKRLQYLDFRRDVKPWDDLVKELGSIKSVETARWAPPRNTPPYLLRAILDLDSSNSADRRGAIEILAESDHQVAREALRRALAHHIRDVRVRAALELVRLKDEMSSSELCILTLKEALGYESTDRDDDSKLKAFETLIKIGRPAFEILAGTTKSSNDPARRMAIGLLAKTGGQEAIPLLLEHMKDSDRSIATSAVDQLGQLKARQAVPMLVDGILNLPAPTEINLKDFMTFDWYTDRGILSDWGSEAARALVRIGDTSIVPRFVEATKDKDPRIRMCAAQVLGKLGGKAAIPILSELLNDTARVQYAWRDTDKEIELIQNDSAFNYMDDRVGVFAVHEIAAKALDQIGTPEVLPLLQHYREMHPLANNKDGYYLNLITLSIDKENGEDEIGF